MPEPAPDIRTRCSLASLNTLALPGNAAHYCEVHDSAQLRRALTRAREREWPVTVLGGGSNVVVSGDVRGLVIRMVGTGVQVVAETSRTVTLRIAAGENWHHLVVSCLDRGWFGLENLALIPGSVGAAPIQNIGAYGVELSQFLESVTVASADGRELAVMTAAECRPGYRDSIFKHELRGQAVITEVTLTLSRVPAPDIRYPGLAERLADIRAPTPAQVAAAVCALRREKLPDPAELPNAGSFFKNPVLGEETFERLVKQYPDIPGFPVAGKGVKVPAAWLIDRAGWKGYRRGHVGVHGQQALVLVHFGGGSGPELLALGRRIVRDIEQRFGVSLQMEPTVIGHADNC